MSETLITATILPVSNLAMKRCCGSNASRYPIHGGNLQPPALHEKQYSMDSFPRKQLGVQRAGAGRTVFVLVVTLLVLPRANGTSWRPLSACEAYGSAGAEFVVQVVASETLSDGSNRTRFVVKEAFKGVSETEVPVMSAPMLDVGAVHLRTGEEYLVFAGSDAEHRLWFGGGSGYPLPASFAVGEIRFLHERAQDTPQTI
jgi:hypothetical protein